MLKFFVSGTDISEFVEYGSLKLAKQANNRRDTASFTSFTKIDESVEVEIFKGSTLKTGISANANSLTFEYSDHIRKNLFRIGDRIVLDPNTLNEEFVEVTSVSGINIGITPARFSHLQGVFGGKKLFGGVTMKTPRREIGTSENMIYSVSAVDYSKVLDQESLSDTYVDQYPREIIGRAIYKATADDATIDISDVESLNGWSSSGVARTPTLSSTNKVFKNYSLQTGATGAGTGKLRFQPGNLSFEGMFDEGGINTFIGLENRSFERPIVSTHIYLGNATQAQKDAFCWSWGGNAAAGGVGPVILPNGSAFGNPTSWHGVQCIGIQDDAWISTPFYVNETGNHKISWYDAYRSYGGANSYTVYIDNVSLGTYSAPSTGWTDRSIDNYSLSQGVHTLKIVGTLTGDKTTFFDNIRVEKKIGAYNWKGNEAWVDFPVSKGVDGGRCMKIYLQAGDYREIQSHQAGYFIGNAGYSIKPNTRYIIKGYMKVKGTGSMAYGARIGLLGTTSSGGTFEFWTPPVLSDNGDWTYYEQEFTTPSNANFAHSACNFYNHGGSSFNGEVYFDKFSIAEVIDATTLDLDKLRFWLYMGNGIEDLFSSIKFRLGSSESSYYEWDAGLYSKTWSYESGKFSESRVIGTPTLNDLEFFEIEFVAKTSSTLGTLAIDHTFLGKNGFTIQNVDRGNVIQKDLRVQFKKPASFVESIAKTNGFYWYVDEFRDIHFFANDARRTPFDLSDTSTNFGSLSITADITNLKNRQALKGGSAPSDFVYDQYKECDGVETSFRLDYPPKGLKVFTLHGGTWTKHSVGVENLVAESSVDFLFNFNEKVVRNTSAFPLIPKNDQIHLQYYPYKDIRVVVQDQTSINRMKGLLGGRGIFDGEVISDETIRTYVDARARALAEVDAYKNPILTANFITEENGLEVGQVIHIKDPEYDIDDDFVVQKLSMKTKGSDGNLHYTVEAGTSLFGLIEFFQLILKKTTKDTIDVSELVDIVYPIDETIIMTDTVTKRKKTPPYFAHSRTGNYSHTLTLTEGGTSLDAYANFSQAG